MTFAARASRGFVSGLVLTLAGVALGAGGGCQKVIGLKEKYEAFEVSDACKSYCSDIANKCTGKEGAPPLLFLEGECEAYCSAVEPLKPAVATADSPFECRDAFASDSESPSNECAAASPTGGNSVCQDDACFAYCEIFKTRCCKDPGANGCKSAKESGECVRRCQSLRSDPGYSRVEGKPGSNYDGDTLQCRYVHLIAAIKTGIDSHCGHAAFQSTLHCFDKPTDEHKFDCPEYCKMLDGACHYGTDNAVYDSRQQCERACVTLAGPGEELLGSSRDYSGIEKNSNKMPPNTIGCRRDHTAFAFEAPYHCLHAGPISPVGSCGDADGPCQSFCSLRAACDPALDLTACAAECNSSLPTSYAGYQVKAAESGSFNCRVRHALQALTLTGNARDAACAMAAGSNDACVAPE